MKSQGIFRENPPGNKNQRPYNHKLNESQERNDQINGENIPNDELM